MKHRISLKQALTGGSKLMWLGATMVLMLLAGIAGGMAAYYEGTGTMPFVGHARAIVPDAPPAVVTSAQTAGFVKNDTTNLVPYGEGFNCVESAFVLALRGRWQGFEAIIVRVDFENDQYSHLLIGYNTIDEGVVYFDPSTDAEVKPQIGGELCGRKIVGMYVLKAEWVPFEVVFK